MTEIGGDSSEILEPTEVGKEVGAFLGREVVEQLADRCADGVAVSRGGFAEEVLGIGKDRLWKPGAAVFLLYLQRRLIHRISEARIVGLGCQCELFRPALSAERHWYPCAFRV